MSQFWSAEAWRIVTISVAGFLLGVPFGFGLAFAAVGIIAYFGWHLRQLHKLASWVHEMRTFNPPESAGVWGEVFHDIYRLQQRNRRRKRRLASILSQYQKATSAMPDATVVLGASGEIQWFNDAARNLLDFKPTQDIGQRIDNLIRHPSFAAFLAHGGLGHLDIPSPRDHLVTISIRIIPYGDEQRLLIARDISERQRLEQMRRDFVGNVSHELRTPLTVIAGFLESMAEDDAGGGGTREWGTSLHLMRQQTIRMQSLVEDLLLLSQLESDSYEPSREVVEVCAMVVTMHDDARLLSGEKEHIIDVECENGLALYGSERELYSAFNNLVTNAVRYTPRGGRIRIRWYSDENGAHFSVIDSGLGIAEENIPRVTERFYRVDPGRSRESGGTGLGLAIVKHVLQRHDGKLRIESRVGRGSTFRCDFPRTRIVSSANGRYEQKSYERE